jgi:hypothetical protein
MDCCNAVVRLQADRGEIQRARSLIVQTKYETFHPTDRSFTVERFREKGEAMKKTLMAVATAATLAVTVLAAPQAAEARGGRIAAGVVGGLIGGALLGGALAGPGYYGGGPAYGPGYGYYGGPAYVAGPPCYWQRQRFWDGYGWRIRRVRVCG